MRIWLPNNHEDSVLFNSLDFSSVLSVRALRPFSPLNWARGHAAHPQMSAMYVDIFVFVTERSRADRGQQDSIANCTVGCVSTVLRLLGGQLKWMSKADEQTGTCVLSRSTFSWHAQRVFSRGHNIQQQIWLFSVSVRGCPSRRLRHVCARHVALTVLTFFHVAAAATVVFFGRRQMEPSLKWMGAFWASIAGTWVVKD